MENIAFIKLISLFYQKIIMLAYSNLTWTRNPACVATVAMYDGLWLIPESDKSMYFYPLVIYILNTFI